jgi:indole-3-glycerol phosphate synthase
MRDGGAVGISVVTEPLYFKGSLENISTVRDAVELPILMKDFIIDERQIQKAAEVGADAVLLIPSICDLSYFHGAADRYGLEALVEVRDVDEVREAADVGARLIGVNNRDLSTLKIDLKTTSRLVPLIRDLCSDGVIVSESGVSSLEDARYLMGEGVDALLVGTSIMSAGDVAAMVRSLVECI